MYVKKYNQNDPKPDQSYGLPYDETLFLNCQKVLKVNSSRSY